MSGCNYTFTIEKAAFIERMAATGIAKSIPLKNWITATACFKETHYP